MNFVSPYWLYAIPVALFVLWLLLHGAAIARKRMLGNFAADRLLAELLRSFSPARRRFKQVLIAIGLITLFTALARPEHGYTWQDTEARGIDVLFVLDSSKSMLAQDIRPNRLERAKFAILDFIDKLESDRIGLVAFAGNAFLQCPLTLDYDAFRLSLAAVDTEVIPHGGTDIARALHEAENAFKAENNHKIVVLITDGEDLEESGIQQAREAAERDVTIYTVGVGTAEGQLIPIASGRGGRVEYLRDSDGNPVMTQLDSATLSDIAEVTDGFYVPLGASGSGLEQVYEAGLASIPEQDLGTRRQKIGVERFQWPLAVAIFLLMWEPLVGTRRSQLLKRSSTAALTVASAAALLALPVMLLPNNVQAQADPTQLYRSGDYEAATTAFQEALANSPEDAELHYNLGNTHFTQGDYEAAIEAYTNALNALDIALQADAFYNMGNARYLLGKEALVDAPESAAVSQGNESAFAQYGQSMQIGNDILRRADANRTPAALRNQQSQQQLIPQEEIQQAIQMAEQAKEATTTAKELSESSVAAGESSVASWDLAVKDYRSALELEPEGDDASYNLDVVDGKLAERRAQDHAARNAVVRQTENAEALEILIEELKKLLEEQQQDDQQNQDQDNQEQQQDQDQQSQDNQQQNDQQNQDQQDQQQENDQQSSSDQSQQQNQENSQQNQENQNQPENQEQNDSSSDQSEQDQQSPEQQEDEGKPEDEKSEGDDENKNVDENDDNSGDQDDGESDEKEEDQKKEDEGKGDGEQPQEAEQNPQEEQPGSPNSDSNQQQGNQPEQQPGSGEEGLSDEQLEELAQQLAEQAEGEKQEGAAEGEGKLAKEVPRIPGVMSREEARRLLDSLKKDDKKLPSIYIPQRYNIDDDGKRKDW